MALPVFMTADVAQIQEFWIRSFAFFVALSFQEDLIQDKINAVLLLFCCFLFQWEFTAQYRPVLLRHFHVQVLSKLAFHKKFLAKEINIAVPESGDLGDPQAGSDGKSMADKSWVPAAYTDIKDGQPVPRYKPAVGYPLFSLGMAVLLRKRSRYRYLWKDSCVSAHSKGKP